MEFFRSSILLAIVAFVAGAASPLRADDKIKIAIASDSTAATWRSPRPERGWGQYLTEYFDSQVSVENFAKPGASTKTFIAEGLWAKAIGSRPGFILIQFGHNDSHTPDHPEHTDPDGLYTDLLRRFVKEARAAGATPILITPVARRTAEDTLIPYVDAMKKVAGETDAEVIDLHRLSQELYVRLGQDVQQKVGAQQGDLTHFNEVGARMIAGIVADELGSYALVLGQHRRGARISNGVGPLGTATRCDLNKFCPKRLVTRVGESDGDCLRARCDRRDRNGPKPYIG